MAHDGKIIGAGLIKGSTKYGECTRPVRNGLPTAADVYIDDYVNHNRLLSKESGTPFFINKWRNIKTKDLSLKEKIKEVIILDRTAK